MHCMHCRPVLDTHTGWPKIVIIILNPIKACQRDYGFFINLTCRPNTIIHGVEYSTCDLISDVSSSSWAMFVGYRLYNTNDASASFVFIKLLIPFVNHLLDES